MQTKEHLMKKLEAMDNKSYKKYKEIQGRYIFDDFILIIDYVQGDPFASPSKVRVRMNHDVTGIDPKNYDSKVKKIALEDFLTRSFAKEIRKRVSGYRGTGKSGLIQIDVGGQKILERTAFKITKDYVEARFVIGLPARGRRVLARQAIKMIFEDIPHIVIHSIIYKNFDKSLMQAFINLAVDQNSLRNQIGDAGLIAFISNGSILPRESGVSDRPMKGKNVVSFISPKSLEVSFRLPNHGIITGMGIPKGITLVVGGGYHGKSTLLNAIEEGVYNHIPNDGRELVVTVDDAVKIRAEDGRHVEKVRITPFISNLPLDIPTDSFSTENASGSTSQATNIMEALEIGTKLLLLDEDTSATNFMIRDGRMQALVAKDKEPITPFIDRIQEIHDIMETSTILVVGGSGDYFDVANHVILMENYIPYDVTQKVKEISKTYRKVRHREVSSEFGSIRHRVPLRHSMELNDREKVKAKGLHMVHYGKTKIDLSYVEQLVDPSQTELIAYIMQYAMKKYMNNERTLNNIIDLVMNDINQKGIDIISPFKDKPIGNLAISRPYEIAAAINRFRKIQMQ